MKKNKKVETDKTTNFKSKKNFNSDEFLKIGSIVLLIGLVIFLLFLPASNESNSVEEEQDVIDENDVENLAFEEAEKLLEMYGFNVSVGCETSVFDVGYTDSYKAYIALSQVDESQKVKKTCSELFDSDNYIGHTGVCKTETEVVSYSVVNDVYMKLYGTDMLKEDVFLSYIGLNQDNTHYDYNVDNDEFIMLEAYYSNNNNCIPKSLGPVYKIKSVENKIDDDGNEIFVFEIYHIRYGTHYNSNEGMYVYTIYPGVVIPHSDSTTVKTKEALLDAVIKNDLLEYADIYEVGFVKKDGNYIFNYLEKNN